MKNQFAKDYYNDYLKNLEEDYKTSRWFSSPEARLDFDQTELAITTFLPTKQYEQLLEIGPGDGVWTDLFLPCAKRLTLLDQSEEMINRAKERLKDLPDISYVVSDFNTYGGENAYDLICAIRCFEYFDDKERAAEQLARLLKPGGRVLIVTKNPEHIKMAKVQQRELHTGQITRSDMIKLLSAHGFRVEHALSATWRFKARYGLMRILFRGLHALHIKTRGLFTIPYVTKALTESYVYVAKKR